MKISVLKPTLQTSVPVVLVIAGCAHERDLEADRTQEMVSLLDTAGRTVVATVNQHLEKPVPGTYIGTGKVEEVKGLVETHSAKEVVFDVQLSPRQQRNLEEETEVRVLDYDELILEIFAGNARTHQAMLAVELAQLEYTKGRLRRMWTHLDRQTVGAGTAGSGSGFMTGTGEKQIEMDRRLVRKRIQDLKGKLEDIAARSDRTVQTRKEAFNVALVGYTNAGKSTLMNALTSAGVLAEDRLFATLDTRTARLHVGKHKNVVLSDTVGFIRNLPPALIASFHATLSEVREADLLLHVVDSSSHVMDEQMQAVEGVLKTIDAERPTIVVFNKVDRAESKTVLAAVRRRYKDSVAVSALTGEGLDQLRENIAKAVQRTVKKVRVRYPATDGALDALIRSRAAIHGEDFDDDQVVLTIEGDERLLGELAANPTVRISR